MMFDRYLLLLSYHTYAPLKRAPAENRGHHLLRMISKYVIIRANKPARREKFMKQFRLLIAFLLLMVCCITAASAAKDGDFEYVVLPGGTAQITEYTGRSKAVTVPDTLGGYPVTSIGAKAFFRNTMLENVTLPDTVTSIGDEAFSRCSSS